MVEADRTSGGGKMALAFDDRDLLPRGVHHASLDSVEQCFGSFQKSDWRVKLFGKLRDYMSALKQAGCASSIIIDGSFVMPCVAEPEDIDLILVLPLDWDLSADLKPYQYNLVSNRRVKQEYGIDVYPVKPDSVDEQKWIAFFSQVNIKWCRDFGWPTDSTRGIVRVTL